MTDSFLYYIHKALKYINQKHENQYKFQKIYRDFEKMVYGLYSITLLLALFQMNSKLHLLYVDIQQLYSSIQNQLFGKK